MEAMGQVYPFISQWVPSSEDGHADLVVGLSTQDRDGSRHVGMVLSGGVVVPFLVRAGPQETGHADADG